MSSVSKIKLPNNTVVDIADKISGYGKFVHLTDESGMPATPDPDTLYLIDDDGSSGDSVVNAVLYSAQTLTTAQKTQARTNIDAQETLVGSGTGQNIKTINNQSILGSGDITVSGGGGDTSSCVHLSGSETITGTKTFTASQTFDDCFVQMIGGAQIRNPDSGEFDWIKIADGNGGYVTLQGYLDDTIGDIETLLNALL